MYPRRSLRLRGEECGVWTHTWCLWTITNFRHGAQGHSKAVWPHDEYQVPGLSSTVLLGRHA